MSDGPLRHLIISREYPPAAYPPGGIGTYVRNIAQLLAQAGETVHVIGERWSGAPLERETLYDGRLVIHRVAVAPPRDAYRSDTVAAWKREIQLLGTSAYPAQRFAWQAGALAETLVEQAGIDVIEAQEWEAPLYYFLLRRALGLGPVRHPPCIVHLHSPTEFIFHHNDWPPGQPEYLRAIRLEEYCIGAADALVCPSRYLARQITARYEVPAERISVIPYPAGDFPFVDRPDSAWNDARIVFIGRLEPRKGPIELVDAAVDVARSHPTARFDFVGDDLWYQGSLTMQRFLERRIPRELRKRFQFHGLQPRARLPRFLARARAAVIPSRWENFPNTCIEAMASGLPVIASPTGGMEEIVEDGVTGWIAPSQAPTGLAEALRRALDTAPARCAVMGRAAAEALQGRCGNEVTTGRHLVKRAETVRTGATRSLRLTAGLARGAPPDEAPARSERRGLGLVIDAQETAGSAAVNSLPGLRGQFLAVTSLRDGLADPLARTQALSAAMARLVERFPVAAVAVVPADVALAPEFLEACQGALDRNPRVGLLTCWMDDPAGGFSRPCPAFPYQWLRNDVPPLLVVRAEAWSATGGLSAALPAGYARWDLVNAVLATGWLALTYPAVLARSERTIAQEEEPGQDCLYGRLRDRFPDRYDQDTPFLARVAGGQVPDRGLRVRAVLRMPVREQLALALDAIRRPRHAVGWLRSRWERHGS